MRPKQGGVDQAIDCSPREKGTAIIRTNGARKQAGRNWERVREPIYDALDKIRTHPVINDFLYRDGVDSEKWYKDSGRILERLVARLLAKRRRR